MARISLATAGLAAVALVVSAALVFAHEGEPGGWAAYQLNLFHDGFQAGEANLHPPLEVAWDFYDGNHRADVGTVVADDTVYAAVGLELMALDVEDGSPKWRYSFPGSFEGVRYTPSLAIANETVYAVTSEGILYAIEGSAGEVLWTFTSGESHGTLFNAAPIVVDDVIYWGTGNGTVFAVLDGEAIWAFNAGEFVNTPTYADGLLFVGSTEGFRALDASTGELRWETNSGQRMGAGAYHDGLIYVGSEEGILYGLDAQTGAAVWEWPTEGPILAESSPGVAYGKVFFASSDGYLYAVDAVSGELRWKEQAYVGFTSTPIILANGVVYLSNGLLLEAFDAETGEPLWDHELGANRTGPLAIADGRLYLGNSDGHVYAFENSESLAEPRTEIGKYVWPALGICGMSGVLAVLVAGAIVLSVRSRRE